MRTVPPNLSPASQINPKAIRVEHTTQHQICSNISLGQRVSCQHGAFSGVGAFVASFAPAECPKGGGGGYVGYIRKALEKGYLEHPGSACCTDNMFEVFVPFRQCVCCLLPLFVNRQLLCLYTNSHNVLLLPPMHHKNLWCAKGLALGVHSGCVSLGVLPSRPKSLG